MEVKKIIIFTCENEEYGIPVEQVISIEKIETLTEVPNLPSSVKGIVSIRDELLPVIDLGICFFERPTDLDRSNQIILVNTERLSLALLVGEVKELHDVAPEQWHEPEILSYQKPAYFSGIAAIEQRLILLLDIERLVENLDIDAIENVLKEKFAAEIG